VTGSGPAAGAERRRLAEGSRRDPGPWKQWGPYVSERAWGTVREDYSADGTAWESFPHDHARSRAYRWSEDGLAGICDLRQHLCLSLAVWNGRDPIVKERIFGLTGNEGNHGEDAKEYWWYLDSTPTHSWMRWRYHYPQDRFPYDELVAENRRRGRLDPEYELADTGVFDNGRYWVVTVDYAKAAPDDVCMRIGVTNAGPEPAELHVIPTLWFRNTWSWGLDDRTPRLWAAGGDVVAEHHELGRWRLAAGDGPSGPPDLLFCENETNSACLFGVPNATAYPKDGINDHILYDAATVNPAMTGTKVGVRHRVEVAAGDHVELRLRLGRDRDIRPRHESLGAAFDTVVAARAAESDEFYREVIGDRVTADEALVARQAFAGMLWGKQLYHVDNDRWLDGDPAGPPPPASRVTGRNQHWRHLNNFDVISMPDKWEYPWYAAWDLAFHCVALAHVDPDFAKHQLTLLCREWYMHPNGQLPAYEWSFDDANPPVHAWAAIRVFEIDGARDYHFLESLFHKLLINFTWWVNRKDSEGNNVFEGGFLGLDNVGPFDRSARLAVAGHLEQSDGTAWMAMYCLNLLEIALVLADHDDTYEDVATKFFEHFAYISTAMNTQGLWDDAIGFYRDVFRCEGGESVPLPSLSMVGLVPLFAVTGLGAATLDRHPDFGGRVRWFLANKPEFADVVAGLGRDRDGGDGADRLLSIIDPDRLRVVLSKLVDERHFLSPYGIRSLSRHHHDHPLDVELGGETFHLEYEPAESRTSQFGGNSNWRGPVWFPLNYLTIEALRRYQTYLGDDFRAEYPTGSGTTRNLGEIADDLCARLVSLFLRGPSGARPALGTDGPFGTDERWHDLVLFHEYFHGDDGRGLGASHQTGWTGLVANLIMRAGRGGDR